ncbi:MAG: S41 family peptidase [Lascolabacillus sp.]|nr:S41 family peptidase [Lascolabacillus sp.]
MKRTYFILLVFSLLLLINTSCNDNDKINDKGELETVTYDAGTKTFKLTYSSGYTETINAIINNQVDPPVATATLEDGSIVTFENANNSGKAEIITSDVISDYKYVNGWIYDNMSVYYLWNDKLSKSPNYSLNPEDFFESILYKYNKTSNPDGDRFSWIQEDYTELLGNLSGVASHEIGFEYILVGTDATLKQYYALVLYAMHGTDAELKGINRGRFITKINGQNITADNYKNLFGGTGTKKLSMADFVYNETEKRYILQSSGDVTINMHNYFAENPIYLDTIYTVAYNKIGYLVYNFFARDNGDKSNNYDKELISKLSNFKSKGVNEMVLDLRYNSGGAVSSAIALASALVKNRSTKNVLTTSQYNSILHNALIKEEGANYNKDYFIDKIIGTTVAIPEMNLPRLYVLTSGWTASASEFIINGLKPYMDVILIGETTYGKNVGSITIYEDDDPKNKWGMQPIVVKFANSLGFSDFTAGFTPDYEIDEFENLYLYSFGDTNDPLLGKALSLITGQTSFTRSASAISTPFRSTQINEKISVDSREKSHRFEMYDDIRGESIRNIMTK